MFTFNNTHIFTGYLKQFLSTYKLPGCKIYTKEFADYLEQHGVEDPRLITSYDTINDKRHALRVNYLRNNEPYHYFLDTKTGAKKPVWKKSATVFYSNDATVNGFTKTLYSPGNVYDTATHEYLGEYLRFLRDYYDINLMSLYNCFTDNICNNVYYDVVVGYKKTIDPVTGKEKSVPIETTFDSLDSRYKIYAIPVKLFSDYTIAIDCSQGIEMFCGFYKTAVDDSSITVDLATKTYKKVNGSIFTQPFLYDKLSVKNFADTIEYNNGDISIGHDNQATRYDVARREHDLKLFLKIPISCKSSITILEGDFRKFNDCKYSYDYRAGGWSYQQNHTVLNFDNEIDHNKSNIKLIHKLQLLALNTGESYPFADRLIEYLSGSAITPIDPVSDNIARTQRVMTQNNHYFSVEGRWEEKMKKIIYDYIVNSGPVDRLNTEELPKFKATLDRGTGASTEVECSYRQLNNNATAVIPPKKRPVIAFDKRQGYHKTLGHNSKSTLYDVLGYVDKDAEKWYASWTKDETRAKIRNNIQNVDIYNGLYDI